MNPVVLLVLASIGVALLGFGVAGRRLRLSDGGWQGLSASSRAALMVIGALLVFGALAEYRGWLKPAEAPPRVWGREAAADRPATTLAAQANLAQRTAPPVEPATPMTSSAPIEPAAAASAPTPAVEPSTMVPAATATSVADAAPVATSLGSTSVAAPRHASPRPYRPRAAIAQRIDRNLYDERNGTVSVCAVEARCGAFGVAPASGAFADGCGMAAADEMIDTGRRRVGRR